MCAHGFTFAARPFWPRISPRTPPYIWSSRLLWPVTVPQTFLVVMTALMSPRLVFCRTSLCRDLSDISLVSRWGLGVWGGRPRKKARFLSHQRDVRWQDITVGADAGTWLEDCWSGSSAVRSLLPFHSVLVGRIGSQPPATTDVLPVGLGNMRKSRSDREIAPSLSREVCAQQAPYCLVRPCRLEAGAVGPWLTPVLRLCNKRVTDILLNRVCFSA